MTLVFSYYGTREVRSTAHSLVAEEKNTGQSLNKCFGASQCTPFLQASAVGECPQSPEKDAVMCPR